MEYTGIKEWMDKLVDSINERNASKDFNSEIRTAEQDGVLVCSGIDILAAVAGEVLKEEKFDVDGVCYRYSFMYREINFKTYCKQRLAGYEEAKGC